MTTNNTKKSQMKSLYISKNVGDVDKYNFFEYLSVMIEGGVSLTDALGSVVGKIKHPFFREKTQEIKIFISSGDSLSRAMKKVPQIFSGAEVSMVQAGETTGKLSRSLASLSDNLRKQHDLKLKIKGAMTYPIIIFLFLILAAIIVLTFVIPAIQPLFETTGVELPWATQLLVSTSDFLRNNYIILIILAVLVIGGVSAFIKTESGREKFHHFLLTFPLIGPVYRNYILAGVAANLGNLISSGVGVVDSMRLVARATDNGVYEEVISKVAIKVSQGEKMVTSMEDLDPENEFFPVDFLQMLAVGEKTATLDTVSKKINTQYTREVDYALANLTKWIEPIALLIAGVGVLIFATAIMGAVLKVTETVQ